MQVWTEGIQALSAFLFTGLITKQITMNTGMKITNAEITSMIECCLMNIVDRTIRSARISLAIRSAFLSLNVR